MARAHLNVSFKAETEHIPSEKALTGGKIVGAILTSGKGFAAGIGQLMVERIC